ncbi:MULTISPECIES: cytochrome P450, partial [unclassified Sphingomonas]|uniref:cytochrome P450 n=1 Tax=unclassified Sphingomonas TaxID=196159 RepID=UPI0008358ECF
PPRHGDVRSVVQRLFAPARLAEPAARARDLAERVFDGYARFDAVADLAQPVSMQTIARVLGLSMADADRLSPHVETLSPAIEVDADPAIEAAGWFALASLDALLADIMRDPQGTLAPSGALFRLRQEIAADPANARALSAQCSLLLFAGHATTQSLIANMVHALAAHPHVLKDVRAGAISMEAVVEETLRFDPPAQIAARSALGPVTIGAQRVEPGQRLLLLLGSANRDPDQFADADSFNPKRSRAVHLAFGGGIHACVGMALARVEARAVLEALVASGRRLSLMGPPRWSSGLSVRTLANLPMALE